jgi:hypothetical protein
MTNIKAGNDYAVLIGDVVGSKQHENQPALFAKLRRALARVNDWIEPAQPLQMTVGDEFQGVYERIGEALEAALLVRLALGGEVDVRLGVAWGTISSYDPEEAPGGQSGEAWWRAREALERVVEVSTKHKWQRTVRTVFAGGPAGLEATVNAFLLCRDDLVGGMDPKDLRITLGLFRGERQTDVAAELGIAQSSVARRQAENGANSVFRAHEQLRGLKP